METKSGIKAGYILTSPRSIQKGFDSLNDTLLKKIYVCTCSTEKLSSA